MTNNSPLLGTHTISSEWYTPDRIWLKVENTFNTTVRDEIFDPCPINSENNGLLLDWSEYKFIYCNPPSPAALWALKALETIKESKDTVIIFAAFSNDLFNQVNELEDYPHVKTRTRIKWIDGREFIEVKPDKDGWMRQKQARLIDEKWYIPNPGYMEESNKPSRYNGFILLSPYSYYWSNEYQQIERRFCEQFCDLGTVQLSRQVYKP